MNRRRFVGAAIAFTLLSTTAARADYVEDIVKLLGQQGYADIEVTRTLLGRVRIVAQKGGLRRELICNPRTGEILRDISLAAEGGAQTATASEGGSGGAGSGGGAEDENDDEDDDDHERHGGGDEDNSGHGGSDDDNSGHGGDDDNSGHGGGEDD